MPDSKLASSRSSSGRAFRLRGPDLHVVLWNAFEAGEVDAPAVITWGHAEPALRALGGWLDSGPRTSCAA